MKKLRVLRIHLVLLTLAIPAASLIWAQSGQEPVKVIEMTAMRYEFSPGEIRVKKGTRVQLKITPIDRTHGFSIDVRPEGTKKDAPEGLRLSGTETSWRLEKGELRLVEFVALQPGIYHFKCSVFCGVGHSGMKGRLIVED